MIWNCAQFKKDLIENKQKKIQGELNLKLEELTGLSKHDKVDDAWKDLKEVVKNVIYIEKIYPFMSSISRYGVDWYKEYYNGTTKDEVNPVRLIADVWSNSSEIGFDCLKRETDLKEWKDYFDECDRTAAGVEGRNAKVVRVLKPTAERKDNEKLNYYVPIKSGSTSWVLNRELKSELKSKHRSEISSTGKLGELVVETCDHKKSSWGFFSLEGPESTFCREILQKFFGDVVKDKRYCLYEMPDTEGFLDKNKK